jgi:hypothetical protein
MLDFSKSWITNTFSIKFKRLLSMPFLRWKNLLKISFKTKNNISCCGRIDRGYQKSFFFPFFYEIPQFFLQTDEIHKRTHVHMQHSMIEQEKKTSKGRHWTNERLKEFNLKSIDRPIDIIEWFNNISTGKYLIQTNRIS